MTHSLFARAAATDAAYFEMGAVVQQLDGASFAFMPGLERLPAGAVVQHVDSVVAARGGLTWLARVEEAFRRVDARLCRIYLDAESAAAPLLQGAGYAQRPEVVMTHTMPGVRDAIELHRVESADDWDRKLQLHRQADRMPDDHGSTAADWVELERRKSVHGLVPYLAVANGDVVGAIGAIACDQILRFKNILIHPAYRRRGLGKAMLAALAAIGHDSGLSQQAVFAVSGDAGERLYQSCGMTVAGTMIEWSRAVSGDRE